MSKVLMVTGSRYWIDEKYVKKVLDQAFKSGYTLLLHGGCQGLDEIAASVWQGESKEFSADWKRFGNFAGPMCNQEMIDYGPDMILAFPTKESRGTYDAVNKARAAGISGAIFDYTNREWNPI